MITIDVKTLLIGVLLLAVIVLVVYLIVLLANLLKTLKKVNLMLDDTKIVSGIVAARANQINYAVSDAASSVSEFASSLKARQGTVSSVKGFAKMSKKIIEAVKDIKK